MNASARTAVTADTRIAVVGMDCRLPGANNVAEFWRNLVDAKESLTTFTDEQLLASGVSAQEFGNPAYVRTRGVIDDMDSFDAGFFNVTPRDAELLDPQQRVFLECAWHALEDAGVDPYATALRIAVFGGAGTPYYLVDALGNRSVRKVASGTSIVTSADRDYLTTRTSFKLDLKGPSMNVQTACSTSLVSVVLGIDSLLNHQSDLVLAGGVSLELPAHRGYLYQSGGLQSPDGRCRTFDKDAAGTVFSRGCAIVALKRLQDAIADCDHVYAVILGGAVNNDGNRKVSFTAPSVSGQVEVVTEALELAGVGAETIGLVEAHGTSTPSGDPIEVASLTEAFRQYTDARGYCRIGSVKTNIGHTDVASGGASLIKMCLALQDGIAPASLNFNEPNPEIDFANSPFTVNTRTCAFGGLHGAPRRAIVNSFGVGGTNACLVLEQAPAMPAPPIAPRARDLLLLSAHDKPALERLREAVAARLQADPPTDLRAFAHTSRSRRRAHKVKAFHSFTDADDLRAQLAQPAAPLLRAVAADATMAWMFPGQGNQFPDMGRALYEGNPVFRAAIDECAALLQPELGLDIREVLYPEDSRRAEAEERLAQTFITQPAIFMVSYATARVFLDLGLKPALLIGHSVGEYVAAALADVMTLESALLAVAFRGRLIYGLPRGSMLAVLKSEAELVGLLPDTLDVAVINSPELVVVSGPDEAIADFEQRMAAQKVFTKLLPTSHAFHSRMMAPSLQPFRDFFRRVALQAPRIPILSTVTGQPMSAEQATDPEYWVRHVVEPVRFAAAARTALERDSVLFLECGPGHSLESAIRRQLPAQAPHAVVSTLREGVDAQAAIDTALARLWVEEQAVDFPRHFDSATCRKVAFPPLPFARTRYSIDFSANRTVDEADKNPRRPDPAQWYAQPGWRRTPAVAHLPRLQSVAPDAEAAWIVFVADALAEEMVRSLRARGLVCLAVRRGDGFRREGDEIALDPVRREHFDMLLRAVPQGQAALRIVYGWTHATGGPALDLAGVPAAIETGFHALVRLEQSMIEHVRGVPASLLVLADDAFDIVGGGAVRPERALAIGPARTLFKEHPEFSSRFVSIASHALDGVGRARMAQVLIEEASIETDEAVVGYVGLARWSECFEALSLAAEPVGGANAPLPREGGVYLVTGGAGGIGRTFSRWIAERVHAHFIWTGRSSLPERGEWDAVLAARRDPGICERIEAIRGIEALGSSVRCFAVDGGDVDALRRVRDEVESTLGPVCGIVHAAGIAGGGVIALHDEGDLDEVLRPKVHGSLVLHELFGERPLDFIHFCSSVTALFGEAGRVDYTSANAFMDAMCQSGMWRHAARATSINWCEWAVVGMGAAWEAEKLRRRTRGARVRHVDALPAAASVPSPALVVLEDGAQACRCRVEIDPQRHWILSEHLLSGRPAMVGTSYVDVLLRWARQRGADGVTLREAAFSGALIVLGDAAPELQLHCRRNDDGNWRFAFTSSADGETWKEHFAGILALEATPRAAVPPLADCLARCPDAQAARHFTSVLDAGGNVMLHYSGRWDCLEEIRIGKDEWVARLELPDRFADDLEAHVAHPSLLDVATSCHFASIAAYRDTYLPYAYGEIVALAPLTRSVLVWGRPSAKQAADGSTLHFDFVIYDEAGCPLMTLHDYTLTRVGTRPAGGGQPGKPVSEAQVKDDAIHPDEARQAIECVLASDLPQVIVHPRDFQREFDETRLSRVRRKLQENLSASQQAQVDDRPELDTDFAEPENDIERGIAAVWSAILGVRRIGANDAFNELGGNSLLAIQVISGIGEEFNVEIKASEFMGSATVRALANLILAKIVEGQDESLLQELLLEQGA